MSADSLIQQQIAKAEKNGREVDYDTAYEEMIADSMEGILSDGKVLEKLKGLQESDPSLWETVKQWAKDIAGKIRAVVDAYKGERMDSTEGKIVANMKEILPQLEELYAEGLADTRGTVDTSTTDHTTGIEGTGVNNVQYSVRNDIVDENGVEYDNVVMLDKPIPKRILSDQKTFAKFLANELFNKKISVLDQNGEVEVIEFAGEKERVSKGGKPRLVRGELTRATGDVRKVIIANLEEVAERSAYDQINSSDDNSHGWLDQNGWESRKTYVTDGETVYEAYLKIGKARDGRNILYALNCDVKKGIAVDKSATSKRAAVRTSNVSSDNLTQPETTVKRKLSDRVISYTPEDIQRMEDELSDVGVRLSDAERRYNSLLNNEDLVSAEKRMKEIRDNSISLREAIRSPEYKAARAERDAIKERLNIEAEKEAYFDLSYAELLPQHCERQQNLAWRPERLPDRHGAAVGERRPCSRSSFPPWLECLRWEIWPMNLSTALSPGKNTTA